MKQFKLGYVATVVGMCLSVSALGETSTSNAAMYNPTTNVINIPLLGVPNILGTPTYYNVDLDVISSTSPLTFRLKNATATTATSTTSTATTTTTTSGCSSGLSWTSLNGGTIETASVGGREDAIKITSGVSNTGATANIGPYTSGIVDIQWDWYLDSASTFAPAFTTNETPAYIEWGYWPSSQPNNLYFDRGGWNRTNVATMGRSAWHIVKYTLDMDQQKLSITVDGVAVLTNQAFPNAAAKLEQIMFRNSGSVGQSDPGTQYIANVTVSRR